jgi:C-terminal of Roc, COR, domain/Ras of Complex, Roc, domain of DAPkinase/Leucine rich repeat
MNSRKHKYGQRDLLAIIQTVSREQVTRFDLSGKGLTEIPEAIGRLTNLQFLDLSNNRLTEIPEGIGDLTELRELKLDDNELSELPENIGSLTQLQTLDLSANQLITLPDEIAQLSALQSLDLSDNQLTTLPEAIAQLTALQELYLSDNQLTTLPEAIAQLTALQELYLSDNQLTTLPDGIGQLTSLQNLYLGYNQLTMLPEAIAQLTALKSLNLDENPLEPDLAAAYEQGLEAVMQYLRAKAEGEIALYEAKLILVGEGEVGKSCLLGALRGDAWVEDRPTTHGIEIKPVIVTAPDCDTTITLNGWDFGGQRVYRPTHRLFFSAPAVYLVVWKPREGPQQGFVKEWITLITHREPDAKILVVATHGGPGQRQPDIDRQELLDLFGNDTVVDFFYVDSKPHPQTHVCNGIAELRAAIATVAAALPEMGRAVPTKWQQVRDILKNHEQPYLPYADVMRLCADQGIDPLQAELFIQNSDRLGHLTHYHKDKDSDLRDIVILKPDWLAKAISFVLDDATTRHRQGLADFAHLSQIWSQPPFPDEPGYPADLHPLFLRLMERFDLSYKVVLDPTQPSTTSLIAQLVPDNRPAQLPDWGEHPQTGDRQQVQICRIVDDRGQLANAEGLFYQLIVRLHKYSLGRDHYDRSIHWQHGLMLDDTYNGRALLEHIGTDVKITVRASYPEFFLFELTKEVKLLIKHFWEGLRCEIMVPCIAPCGKKQPGTALFEVEKLIGFRQQGLSQFPCTMSGCLQLQNIDELMRNAPTSRQAAVENLLVEEFGTVKDRLDNLAKDIRTLDSREHQRFQKLDNNDRRILSQADERFAVLMQMLTDEAKEGPRLFSFKPVNPKFFDRPNWISAKFQITLWCEHARQPLPVLNPNNPQAGVYHLDLPRKWLVKAAPLLKIMSVTLGLILPVASSTTKLMLDDATYKDISEQLDLGQKSVEFALKGSDLAVDWQAKGDKTNLEHGDAIRVEGSMLRELHVLLKKKDPGFGGLVRVQNKRREFLWVHPQFVDEY